MSEKIKVMTRLLEAGSVDEVTAFRGVLLGPFDPPPEDENVFLVEEGCVTRCPVTGRDLEIGDRVLMLDGLWGMMVSESATVEHLRTFAKLNLHVGGGEA